MSGEKKHSQKSEQKGSEILQKREGQEQEKGVLEGRLKAVKELERKRQEVDSLILVECDVNEGWREADIVNRKSGSRNNVRKLERK